MTTTQQKHDTRPDPGIQVIPAATAPHFDLPGVQFAAGAAPSRGSAEICVWTLTVDAGHTSHEAHTLDRDEVFVVVSGTVRLQDDAEPLQPGDTAVVPARTPIQVANPGDGPATVVVAVSAGFGAWSADGTPIGTPPWAQ